MRPSPLRSPAPSDEGLWPALPSVGRWKAPLRQGRPAPAGGGPRVRGDVAAGHGRGGGRGVAAVGGVGALGERAVAVAQQHVGAALVVGGGAGIMIPRAAVVVAAVLIVPVAG